MEFSEAISIISKLLVKSSIQINSSSYDGLIVKKLEASNTLDTGRTTNQTHIAITGPQMDIFPYLKAEGYFSKDYDRQDNELKKYFITQVPACIFKMNIEYLETNELENSIDFNGDEQKRTMTSIIRSRRKDASDQIQMSLINMDSPEFISFRKLIHSGSYIIILKRKNKLEYEFYGIKSNDTIDGNVNLANLNNLFFKLPTNTNVDVTSIQIKEEVKEVEGLSYNRIVFGAPGTGKSYRLENDRKSIFANNYERVTFHPNYSYAQFVGTYKPVPSKDSDGKDTITYKYIPGPFMRIYVKAVKSMNNYNHQPFLLLIEEINRANVAAVFGDIFQLLDRKNGISEYEIEASEDLRKYLAREFFDKDYEECSEKEKLQCDKMKIPANMYIWATMNSADQGVFPIDTAFKRRWDFEYIGINENADEIENVIVKLGKGANEHDVNFNKLRIAINNKLSGSECKVNEDKLFGPYFLSKEVIKTNDNDNFVANNECFIEAFKNKVLMYLYEDAAKQHKSKIFVGCDYSKYSSVCRAFEEKGEEIFGEDVVTAVAEEE